MSTIIHYATTEGFTNLINPGEYGIHNLHFGILNLPQQSSFFDHTADCEVVLIALGGQCTLLVGHNGNKANGILGERIDVFEGDACVAFIPHHTTYEVITNTDSVEIAICKTPSHSDTAAVILNAGEKDTESNYQLSIRENDFTSDLVGEAVCLYRCHDTNGYVTLQIVEPDKKAAQVVLHHNDMLVVPEKTRAHLIKIEGVCYQLSVSRSTPLQ